MRTSRGAVPGDKALRKLCHGHAGLAGAGGLSRAQFDALRAYRDGWEWSPYMPRLEGFVTMPTTSRYCVLMAAPVTKWDEPMWIVRVVYTAPEGGMANERITIGCEHPRGSCFYEEKVFWRIMRAAGLDTSEWFMTHQPNDFGGTPHKKNGGVCFQIRADACERSTATRLRRPI